MAITPATTQQLTVDPDQLEPGDYIRQVTFVAVDENDRAIPVLLIDRVITTHHGVY